MRFLLGGFGSRGDVQPMLALALALKARGHAVTFLATPDFAGWVQSLGLPFVPAGESMEAVLARTEQIPREMPRAVAESLRAQFRAMEPLVADHDVLAASSISLAGASLAEKHGKRYHAVWFAPQAIPSAHYQPMHWTPNERFHSLGLPRWLNRLSWWVWQAVWNAFILRQVVREERARLGLPQVAHEYRHMVLQRTLLACDPQLAPLPPDVAALGVTQTGAWFMPETDELSAEVRAFLAQGPAPVYVGFGSMKSADAARTTRQVLEAARLAGARLLLSRGWAQLGEAGPLPPTALVLGPQPHGQLFPRCAAVVHHGGAGTTVTAARAGVPQVVVPHYGDQFYWGQRAHALGIAAPPVPKRRLCAQSLAAGVRACLSDDGLRRRAAAFAASLQTDGLERAVSLLEVATRR